MVSIGVILKVFLLSLSVSFFVFVGTVSPSSLWLVGILVTAGIYCEGFRILTMPCHNTLIFFIENQDSFDL